MLDYLRIRDLALIEDMELEFAPGMNVLTGETGAGKSFILKALGFLLGDRLASDMIRPGRERAQVEALFVLPDRELILRRELMAESGRSRLYVNDKLSSQESVRELRSTLILHTSQHGQHRLLQPTYQAKLIDEAMNRPDLLGARDAILKELHELFESRDALRKKFQTLAERRDLLEMQQREIDAVAPEPGEEERLEAQRTEARETSNLAENYDQALLLLHGDDGPGLLDLLAQLEQVLHDMSRLDENLLPDMEAVSGLRQNLSHLERRLRRPPEPLSDIDTDAIEARLFELAQLKRKLRRSLDEIISMRNEITENISFLDVYALDLKRLDREEAALHEQLRAVLADLLPTRRAAGADFARALEKELAGLGFSEQVRVEILFTPTDICPGIQDERPRILWAPNPGQHPQPLDKIASGGELSRFLLALVGIQSGAETATYIFDEVDAGVGGLTLNRVAERLGTLAKRRQMLLITHWPQLAVQAARHFQIAKVIRGQETFTLCSQLDDAARMEELARMAGGGDQGKALARTLKG